MFAAGTGDLALAGGNRTAAMRLAAQTRREVVVYAWLLIRGRAVEWAEIDPLPWRHAWVSIFRQLSFTVNGQLSGPPDRDVILYRGCGPGGALGLSWSPNTRGRPVLRSAGR
jgi:hypothetical protein